MHMVKRWLTLPKYDREVCHLDSLHIVKDDWPPSYNDRSGSQLFLKLRFNMHMVKRWLTLPGMTDQDLI